MRVAVVTPGSFAVPSQRNSSVERVVTEISEQLKEELHFVIFSKKLKNNLTHENKQGVTHVRPPRAAYRSGVVRWLAKTKPDIIQVENRPKLARMLRSKFRRKTIWLSLHSTQFISTPHISLNELKACLRSVDNIIVNSLFLQEYLKARVPGIENKIAVNYPGVDPARFLSRWTEEGRHSREAHVRQLGYENKKLVLYAGRLQEIKGVHHVLEAMPAIIQENPNVILIIVGSAYYGKETLTPYVKQLHQLGNRWPGHVRFIPFVPHHEMASWFRLADVAVVPSAENEAFGLVNVEAMASGVPVVATRTGGMKEIIRHHETGILVDSAPLSHELAKAVNRLLKDQQLARRMGELGSAHVNQQFTWRHTAERYRQLVYGSRV